ncbi:MAG: hypothetical protein GTO16_10190 [Candidatus Aminicenantes bacterium]|nr:hypothetical protein [Candidatus Aminicenantes bacterium]
MSFKKIIVGISLPLFLTSVLSSQSLVELAKKEKERREKLKGQSKTVITNADLSNIKRGPALTTSRQADTIEGSEVTGSSSEASAQDKSEPSRARPRSTRAEGADRVEPQENTQAELEQKWKSAREQVGLLTTRMNGLWQEFYSMDDMSSREEIQREISETSLRLQKAKEEEAKARQEYQAARSGARTRK